MAQNWCTSDHLTPNELSSASYLVLIIPRDTGPAHVGGSPQISDRKHNIIIIRCRRELAARPMRRRVPFTITCDGKLHRTHLLCVWPATNRRIFDDSRQAIIKNTPYTPASRPPSLLPPSLLHPGQPSPTTHATHGGGWLLAQCLFWP